MPFLQVYVTDDTLRRLRVFAETERPGATPEALAEAAVEEAAIQAVPILNGKPMRQGQQEAWEQSDPAAR